RPGKQPGDPGTTMSLADDPDERTGLSPPACRGCGADLAGVPVLAQRRHQVTGIAPAPPPTVTGYVAQARACPCCGIVSEAVLPARVAGPRRLRPRGARAGRESGQRALH